MTIASTEPYPMQRMVGCGYEMSREPGTGSRLCGRSSVVKLRQPVTHATLWLCRIHASVERMEAAANMGWQVVEWL